jgi:hypothetical protein
MRRQPAAAQAGRRLPAAQPAGAGFVARGADPARAGAGPARRRVGVGVGVGAAEQPVLKRRRGRAGAAAAGREALQEPAVAVALPLQRLLAHRRRRPQPAGVPRRGPPVRPGRRFRLRAAGVAGRTQGRTRAGPAREREEEELHAEVGVDAGAALVLGRQVRLRPPRAPRAARNAASCWFEEQPRGPTVTAGACGPNPGHAARAVYRPDEADSDGQRRNGGDSRQPPTRVPRGRVGAAQRGPPKAGPARAALAARWSPRRRVGLARDSQPTSESSRATACAPAAPAQPWRAAAATTPRNPEGGRRPARPGAPASSRPLPPRPAVRGADPEAAAAAAEAAVADPAAREGEGGPLDRLVDGGGAGAGEPGLRPAAHS